MGVCRGKCHFTVDLLFDWFELVCFANKNKIGSCHTADSKLFKQEINGTVILPPLVLLAHTHTHTHTHTNTNTHTYVYICIYKHTYINPSD